ncbi:MAG: DUF255 domain-containing protein [Bacteroidia bacterium]|nr:DUF255 domain-containing protein [Bacteroidia bacterium]
MRKSTLLLFVVLLIITNSFKQAEEIKWVDFNTGYNIAVKKKKIMLIDVYTDWCGWCKVMDRETYAKSEIAEIINKNFVAIKFNPETPNVVYTYNGGKFNGKGLRDTISNRRINGYPATLFFNTKNQKTNLVSGYLNPEEFKAAINHSLIEVGKTTQN